MCAWKRTDISRDANGVNRKSESKQRKNQEQKEREQREPESVKNRLEHPKSACLCEENEPFSTAERSEGVENFLFGVTCEYTEAGIEQAIVAMQRLGANSPEPRKRAVHE